MPPNPEPNEWRGQESKVQTVGEILSRMVAAMPHAAALTPSTVNTQYLRPANEKIYCQIIIYLSN